jgi:hypothetical protein
LRAAYTVDSMPHERPAVGDFCGGW